MVVPYQFGSADADGSPNLVTEYVCTRSDDGGATWEVTGRSLAHTRHYWHVGFPDGRMIRIYGTSFMGWPGEDRNKVVVEESTDGGTEWRQIARFLDGYSMNMLNSETGNWYEIDGLPNSDYQPMIIALPDGRFLNAWHTGSDHHFGSLDMITQLHSFRLQSVIRVVPETAARFPELIGLIQESPPEQEEIPIECWREQLGSESRFHEILGFLAEQHIAVQDENGIWRWPHTRKIDGKVIRGAELCHLDETYV